MTSPHLNDDQFADCLLGSKTNSAQAAHLLECPGCREELELFRSSVENFNSMSLVWSEKRSATSPTCVVSKGSSGWVSNWAWSMAIVMLLSVGTSLHTRNEANQASSTVQTSAPNNQNSEAEIAKDNELMKAVNREISRKEPFPLLADNVPVPRYGRGVKKQSEVRSE